MRFVATKMPRLWGLGLYFDPDPDCIPYPGVYLMLGPFVVGFAR